MARWQLTEAHALHTIPPTKWEWQQINRMTGRPERKIFNVPLHLDPNIEGDWNYQERIGNNIVDGKIIVCHEGKGEPKDIVFTGDPTPGMLPIDDEARAISSRFSWTPTQGLDEISQANSHQQQILVELSNMKDQVRAAPQVEGMADLMKAMAEMMTFQRELLSTLAGKPALAPELPKHRLEAEERPAQAAKVNFARRLAAQAAEPTE